jgi:hypothetical protein
MEPMEGYNNIGYNICFPDFRFNLHRDLASQLVYHVTFEVLNTCDICNVVFGMIECDANGSLGDSAPAVSIGNTNGGFNSFGVHSDDGSCIVGRKDEVDGWQKKIKRNHLIWWGEQGPTAQYGVNKEENTNRKFTMSLGLDRNKQEFFFTCGGKDKEYLPEVLSQNGGKLSEWWSNPSSIIMPVVSFDYTDKLKSESLMKMSVERDSF